MGENKLTYEVGDFVRIKPWDEVVSDVNDAEHAGISRITWRWLEQRVLKIHKILPCGLYGVSEVLGPEYDWFFKECELKGKYIFIKGE